MKRKINKLMTAIFATVLLVSGAATSLISVGTIHAADDTGSIIIHKHEAGDAIGDAGDGQELSAEKVAAMGDPIADVPYLVYAITSKLSAEQLSDFNNALSDADIVKDLHAFSKATETLGIDNLNINFSKVSPANSVTDADGNLTIDDLPINQYYLVIEQPVRHVSLPQSEPFVVRIPTNITVDDHQEEIKDVHVYPKGKVLSFAPQKRVGQMSLLNEGAGVYELDASTDGGIGVGGSNFYTMSMQMAPGYTAAGIPNAKIEISDIFPEALQLTGYESAADLDNLITIYGNRHNFGVMAQKINLDDPIDEDDPDNTTKISDYLTVSYAKNGSRNELKVTLQNNTGDSANQAALNKFLDSYNRLYFSFEVENTSTDGYQTFPNDIEVNYWRDAENDEPTISETTVEEATMHTGGFKYTKMTDESDQLPGATFRVGIKVDGNIEYIKVIKNSDGKITKVLLPGDEDYDNNSAVYYESVSSNDENEKGVIEFNGLPVYENYKYVASATDTEDEGDSDEANSDEEVVRSENMKPVKMKYYVVETEAPAGFEKLTQPREVMPDELSSTEPTDEYSTIVNVKKFTLPFTGIAGWWMFLLGFVIVGAAAFFLIRNQRKAKVRV